MAIGCREAIKDPSFLLSNANTSTTHQPAWKRILEMTPKEKKPTAKKKTTGRKPSPAVKEPGPPPKKVGDKLPDPPTPPPTQTPPPQEEPRPGAEATPVHRLGKPSNPFLVAHPPPRLGRRR